MIKTALVQEWSTLSESDISSLRQYLLHYVIGKPTLAPYVRARILQVIAIIIKRGSVDDFGQERRQILNEVESLIRNDDLPKVNILKLIQKKKKNKIDFLYNLQKRKEKVKGTNFSFAKFTANSGVQYFIHDIARICNNC